MSGINDCASNPCLNGGQCVDEVDSFRCQCASGFNGKRCEVEKNECSSNPCYGKATCVDKVLFGIKRISRNFRKQITAFVCCISCNFKL